MKRLRPLAILTGVAVDQGASVVATVAAVSPFVIPLLWQGRPSEINGVLGGPLPTAISILVGTAVSVGAGWVAGRMTRRTPWNPLWNGAAVGAGDFLIDLCFLGHGRLWLKLAALVVTPTATTLGGWLAGRGTPPVENPQDA